MACAVNAQVEPEATTPMKIQLLAATALAFLAACHGPSLDVGSSVDAGTDGSPAPGTTWNGYFESFQLLSGSDHVTLKVNIAPDGTVTGTALLGDLPLLDPPTNPDLGYPAPILPDGGGPPNTLEHFKFTILDGRIENSRFTFRLQRSEMWGVWCQLQTRVYPYRRTGTGEILGYSCVPNTTSGPNPSGPGCFWHDDMTNTDVQIDCNKLALCGPQWPCSCTPTRCADDLQSTYPGGSISFDLHMSDGRADGSVTGIAPTGPPITVHFTRQ